LILKHQINITEFDQNETREYVNLEVHADYFVRIKTEQIKPILQVILQLYDGQSQDIKVVPKCQKI
jgi:hypothetical protein